MYLPLIRKMHFLDFVCTLAPNIGTLISLIIPESALS
jgi:hypothetical protein